MLLGVLLFIPSIPAQDPPLLDQEDLASAPSPERPAERSVPALFFWGDADGDGRLDLAAVGAEGTLQLLSETSAGRFEDVTREVGLSGIGNAALVLWMDYDLDGRLDLFVGARAGASRLFRNDGGTFTDTSAASGLVSAGAVCSADWLDHDGDGRPDLHLVSGERHELYRGLEGGFFERVELPELAAPETAQGIGAPLGVDVDPLPQPSGAAPAASSPNRGATIDASLRVGRTRSSSPLVVGPSGGTATTSSMGLIATCFPAIRDQANPGSCIQASTTPTLGRLYPISANLFVALAGDVGIGTTSPGARLHVAGTARIADTLTLAPGGDAALDVSTGSIYKGGALFIHTKGLLHNTALGRNALANVTTGYDNTASGEDALNANTTGFFNTASGSGALRSNTTGYGNTASGASALSANTTGWGNTASGAGALIRNTTGSRNTAGGNDALHLNTTGYGNTASGYGTLSANTTGMYNTAFGHNALGSNTTGARNIALGRVAGSSLTTGNDNIDIGNTGVAGEGGTIRMGTAGTHTRTFIAGIRGVTTGVADAVTVLVDSAGQLGTVSSSRRFKEEIRDMGDLTERLLELRPVVFRYKPEVQQGERPLEYGLIAEEVAEVFPELVVRDEEGKPFTVKYHLLSTMLLNELEKLHGSHAALAERVAALEARGEPALLR